MMYCTADDLIANIPGLTADNKKAPTPFLNDVIKRKTAHINSMISRRYEIPVNETSSPISFAILKDICIELSRSSVTKRLSMKSIGGDAQTPSGGEYSKSEKRLYEIRSGNYDLPDAVECPNADCDVFGVGSYDATNLESLPYPLPTEDDYLYSG